jgi:hypothetical protein
MTRAITSSGRSVQWILDIAAGYDGVQQKLNELYIYDDANGARLAAARFRKLSGRFIAHELSRLYNQRGLPERILCSYSFAIYDEMLIHCHDYGIELKFCSPSLYHRLSLLKRLRLSAIPRQSGES